MDINVYLLYSSIIFIAFFLAYKANGKVHVVGGIFQKQKFDSFYFWTAFLVLCFFTIFTDTGVDYYNYYRQIERGHDISDIYYYNQIEPLFTLWSHYGWIIFNGKIHVVIATMKFVTILLYFLSFYMMRAKINVAFSVLLFSSIAFLPSFSIIRIVLASSFLIFGCALYFNKKPLVWVLFFMLLGVFMHFSSIMLLIAVLTYLLLFKYTKDKVTNKYVMFILIFFILFSTTQTIQILSSFISLSDSFDHYQKYVDTIHSSSFGVLFVLFISYSLIGGTLYLVRKCFDIHAFLFMQVLVIYAFSFEFLGTQIPVLERSTYVFMPVYCLIFPYCIQSYSIIEKKKYSSLELAVILFCVFRLYFVFKSRVMPDSDSQLYYYHFFNPFTA